MDQQKAFGRITKRVPIERSILTYRLAARELGCTVQQAKAFLRAYFESDVAKERGVGAVWLISGRLARPPSSGRARPPQDGMELDPIPADTPSSQDGTGPHPTADAESEEAPPQVERTVLRLVQDQDLQAQLALFASEPEPPRVHLYALLPTLSLPSLALLGPSALSLVSPAQREKWRPVADAASSSSSTSTGKDASSMGSDTAAAMAAYGGIVHPEGERRKVKASTGAAAAGKGKAPLRAGGTMGTSARAKGEDGRNRETDTDTKPPVQKTVAAAAGKKAGRTSAAGARAGGARPIGQLGGLFSKTFDRPDSKKKNTTKKGKARDSDDSSSSGEEKGSEQDEEDKGASRKRKKNLSDGEEDVKPAPARAQKKSTGQPRSPAVNKKKVDAPAPGGAGPGEGEDEFGDWAMDEEALLEAEREAEQQAAARKKSAGAGGAAKTSAVKKPTPSRAAGETKAERQKRELEEMMQSEGEDSMDVDSKPVRAPPSRTPSSSSLGGGGGSGAFRPKAKSSASATQQTGISAFFKKK